MYPLASMWQVTFLSAGSKNGTTAKSGPSGWLRSTTSRMPRSGRTGPRRSQSMGEGSGSGPLAMSLVDTSGECQRVLDPVPRGCGALPGTIDLAQRCRW